MWDFYFDETLQLGWFHSDREGLRRIRIGMDNSRRIDKFLFPVVAVPASSHPLLC